jgi:hypothetical protein
MGLITSTISAKEEVPVLASIDVLGVYLAARCSPHNRFTVTMPCSEKLRSYKAIHGHSASQCDAPPDRPSQHLSKTFAARMFYLDNN